MEEGRRGGGGGQQEEEDEEEEEEEERGEGGGGGLLVDFHSCWFFPPEWFDLVVVLRTETAVLYERLENKLYRENKITQNIECEIFQVVYDEAREQFPEEVIVQFNNNTPAELQFSVDAIKQWVEGWTAIRRKRNKVVGIVGNKEEEQEALS
eukprot:GHVS01095555.1.p1 GENE.GHVS01095555.1~~GHVS01095555.1.p1  ORF type:complete len:152 (+),score=59.10 GHVS01095555.1:3-458(+)